SEAIAPAVPHADPAVAAVAPPPNAVAAVTPEASAPAAPHTDPAIAAAAPPPNAVAAVTPEASAPPGASAGPAASPTIAAPVIPSQTAAGIAAPPIEKFKTDPLAAPVVPIVAAPNGTNYLPADGVTLMAGTSRVFDFAQRLRRVSVADTAVADLQVVNPYQLNLIAHKEGFTTLAVWDNQGHYEERQVRVDRFGKQQVLLNCIVAELDRNRMETQAINWSGVLNNYNVSLVGLGAGGVAAPYSPNTILGSSTIIPGLNGAPPTILSSSAQGTIPAGGTLIPLLLSESLNYGLSWGNSVGQAQAFFNFLETHSFAKILAEPHLLANSGEKAEFLSGGEIPIVIAQALNTSIVFKQFGTKVSFVPTVVSPDDIEMSVKPEVSQPDYTHAVTEFGFNIPAFVTRKADTFVRIKNNQTLIIAGLLQHTKTSEVDKTPYLGDLPYVGSLFRHTTYSDQNTDLVMSVTPQIVQALPANGQVAAPTARGPLSDEEIRTERLAQPDASRPRF
ncbi:MAG: pilus assembly protein N-terminal domain-containing protein, partial [Candidatus Binataceae bacterium]